MHLHTISTLKSISIPLLLDWWQQRKRTASARSNLHRILPKGDDGYLQAYYRLMEVYSVIKSGGVKAQTEAAKAFADRESTLLHQRLSEIASSQTLSSSEQQQAQEQIQNELSELRSAYNWRVKALSSITPEEESLVMRYLPDIERTLMQVQCA